MILPITFFFPHILRESRFSSLKGLGYRKQENHETSDLQKSYIVQFSELASLYNEHVASRQFNAQNIINCYILKD